MDEQEIKSLRHSFTTSKKEEATKVKINQFGHTVLGDENLLDVSNIKIALNEHGEVEANSEGWLENNDLINKLSESLHSEPEPPLTIQSFIETQKSQIQPHLEGRSIYTDLISELDEMANSNAGISKPVPFTQVISSDNTRKTTTKHKHCINKQCLCELPEDAKFCLKCGTAQLSQFCTECGFHFPGLEKFCPDCGTKR